MICSEPGLIGRCLWRLARRFARLELGLCACFPARRAFARCILRLLHIIRRAFPLTPDRTTTSAPPIMPDKAAESSEHVDPVMLSLFAARFMSVAGACCCRA
jgi:hypothetical protein